MFDTLTVYNCSPAPRGYSHGSEIVRLAIGATKVKRGGLVAALHRPKSDLKALMDQGLLRLDGFYPSQVFRPKKVATTGPDITIEDPAKPTPTPELRPLYSTQAPCAKMLALYEATKPVRGHGPAPKVALIDSHGNVTKDIKQVPLEARNFGPPDFSPGGSTSIEPAEETAEVSASSEAGSSVESQAEPAPSRKGKRRRA